MKLRIKSYCIIISLALFSCSRGIEQKAALVKKENAVVKYARRFAIEENEAYTSVYLFGDRENYDTTDVFILYKSGARPLNTRSNAFIIKIPCEKIAALSSIYANMFYELGNLNNLAAVDNMDYIINPDIVDRFNAGNLKELAKTPQVDIEQTVVLKPDIIFNFGMGRGQNDKDKKLAQTNIPLAISVDHLEETPLGRAEWIKFFAAFVDKKKEADSLFDRVEKNYRYLHALAANTKERPTIFTETKYGDFWYMPGGKSYVAQLLNDAGANYLWKDNADFGSLPLSFEQVYVRAKDADFWLNLSVTRTRKELLSYESRYDQFKSFRTGNLYNNTKHINDKGYSTYWETGMIYPDRILSDLILIIHPELKTQIKSDLYYYERLQ